MEKYLYILPLFNQNTARCKHSALHLFGLVNSGCTSLGVHKDLPPVTGELPTTKRMDVP